MSKIKRFFKKKSILRTVLSLALVLVTVGALVGGVVALTRNTDRVDEFLTYKSIGSTKYSIGGLAPSNGAYMSTDKSIYTDKAFECQGLNITPVFDCDVTYQVFFYDQNNEFVHTTGILNGTFVQDSVPFFAKYARIVITPKDDNKVTIFEKSKYAKQLEVTVYREQGYKNYTEDLFRTRATGYVLDNNGDLSEQSDDRNIVSDYINIKAYNEVLFFRTSGEELSSGFKLHLYDSAKAHLGSVGVANCETIFVSSNGDHYYKITLASLNASTVFISYSTFETNPVHFYCR